MKHLVSLGALLVMVLSSAGAFAANTATFAFSLSVTGSASLSSWAKELANGETDPGFEGIDRTTNDVLKFDLEYQAGKYKSKDGRFFAIFLGVDSSSSCNVTVETTGLEDSIAKGIAMTVGFATGDMFADPATGALYADSPVNPSARTEQIGNAVNLAESSTFHPAYDKVTYSWKDLRSNTQIYNSTAGVVRILRCYVSVAQAKAFGDPDKAAFEAMINSGKLSYITSATQANQNGTIKFTLTAQ